MSSKSRIAALVIPNAILMLCSYFILRYWFSAPVAVVVAIAGSLSVLAIQLVVNSAKASKPTPRAAPLPLKQVWLGVIGCVVVGAAIGALFGDVYVGAKLGAIGGAPVILGLLSRRAGNRRAT
jgi:uncharacterized membrane protein